MSTLSPLEVLGAVGAITSSVLLGTSVLVSGYHRPVNLAHRLATLDLLTEGRIVLGLGVGGRWTSATRWTCRRPGVEYASKNARVVRSFDGWNPAGLPVDHALDRWHQMQAVRDPSLAPLSKWLRTFLCPPNGVADRSFDALADEISAASESGMDHVVVDPNFSDRSRTPAGWMDIVERLGAIIP